MLDLFCGRWGWSKAFAARGWECIGIDIVEPPFIPNGCRFIKGDILEIEQIRRMDCLECDSSISQSLHNEGATVPHYSLGEQFDFICASSPCEQFSVHGMKCFHPNPKYPELGIKLFNHTRQICEASGVPYVMENARSAQAFVGNAANHCGPFYLWGNVPPILPGGILKGKRLGVGGYRSQTGAKTLKESAAIIAEIPIELSSCVADYARRISRLMSEGKETVDA